MANFPIPPTFALPMERDQVTGDVVFNPIWLRWFLDVGAYFAGYTPGAATVPNTRLISTTAPLAGGGDLSADRTLSVGTFDSTHSGVVPASGGGIVNFLRADGTWKPAGGAGATWTSTTVAFGATPVDGATFTIVDASVLATSTIEFEVSGADSTADNTAADHAVAGMLFEMSAVPGAGTFDLNVLVLISLVTGQFKIRYRVGA